MFDRTQKAMNPEARSRADRPCLEGSEWRNRLSGDTHAAGFRLLSACDEPRATKPRVLVLLRDSGLADRDEGPQRRRAAEWVALRLFFRQQSHWCRCDSQAKEVS